MIPPSALVRSLAAPTFVRRLAIALVSLVFATFAAAQDAPLRVAVYDVPPYRHVEPDGSIDGLSVDLWRRAAENLGREYHLVAIRRIVRGSRSWCARTPGRWRRWPATGLFSGS